MADNTISTGTFGASPPLCSEPLQSEAPGGEALMCVETAPEGVEGSGSGGSAALVRRFSGEGGAPGEITHSERTDSCADEAAVAALTSCNVRKLATGSPVAVFANAAACLFAVNDWLACVSRPDDTVR